MTSNTEDFILQVELSAKKILKTQARKARDRARGRLNEAQDSASQRVLPPAPLHSSTLSSIDRLNMHAKSSPLRSRPNSGNPSKRLPTTNTSKSLSSIKLQSLTSHSIKTNNRLLEKLQESPYNSLMKSVEGLPSLSPSKGKQLDVEAAKESNGAIRKFANDVVNNRVSNIAHISKQQKIRADKMRSDAKYLEAQGPIDWTSQSLKRKYRGEVEREAVWEESQRNIQKSERLFTELGVLVPTVIIDRHPVFRLFHSLLSKENFDLKNSIVNRLAMKRFVCDIQEVWLSNLPHLAEHALSTGDSNVSVESPNSLVQHSLRNRRDKDAILSMKSQIQSVSFKRAMQRAYITTQLNPPQLVLDYVAPPPPQPVPQLQIPPEIQHLYIPFNSASESIMVDLPRLFFVDRILASETHSALWRIIEFYRNECSEKQYFATEDSVVSYCNFTTSELSTEDAKQISRSLASECNTKIPECFAETTLLSEIWKGLLKIPAPSLSILICGKEALVSNVPGVCEFGAHGLWVDTFTNVSSMELEKLVEQQRPTRVALRFFRDQSLSQSNSVLVTAILAIDLFNLVAGTFLAWEDGSTAPPHAPSEDIESHFYLPRITAIPITLLKDDLKSEIHSSVSHPIVLHTMYRRIPMSCDLHLKGTNSSHLDTYDHGALTTQERNDRGFRQKLFVELTNIDSCLSTKIFGM